MTDGSRVEHDAEVLPAKLAERVLKRASELDAARSAGTPVAELRAAAAAAGISAHAFDAALGEMQKAEQTPVPVPEKSARRWRNVFFAFAAAVLFILFLAMVAIPKQVAARPASNTIDYAIKLNCVSAEKALDVITPLLKWPENKIVRPAESLNTIVINGTPKQIRTVRDAVEKIDNAESCARK